MLLTKTILIYSKLTVLLTFFCTKRLHDTLKKSDVELIISYR